MSVQKLRLASGRSLDFIIEGSSAEDALTFVYIHGTPSAYPVMRSLIIGCQEHNFKLISFSRAGYGDSSRHAGRSVVDIVDDVKSLLEHLKVKECVVGGWSGGGPHALACAARLESCVGSLCIAGVAPYVESTGLDWLEGQGEDNVQEFKASLEGEEPTRAFVDAQRKELIIANAAGIVEEMSSILPDIDKKALLENQDVGSSLEVTFKEALKNNSDGWVDDDLAFVKPWEFELSEIKKPVFLYQGSLDLMVPYGHGQWLAKNLPQEHLTTHLIEGEGHISIWLGYMDSMLKELSSLRR
ncbi:hypothetical protein CBS101457_000048 [Exobasidium rhododendri]|nr:hypothetical protein CBS101457_000048 [Exobasidium rhododendri]